MTNSKEEKIIEVNFKVAQMLELPVNDLFVLGGKNLNCMIKIYLFYKERTVNKYGIHFHVNMD